MSELKSLLTSFHQKNIRSLGRLISEAENENPQIAEILASLYLEEAATRVIGITGPPGAGKSTLCSELITRIRKSQKTIAVLSIDPMSPFSGGALLGDRIRLSEHFGDSGVYIRSLSTRGKLGGLSIASRQTLHLLQCFGFDYLLIETVGVGQSEIDIHQMADVTLLVLVPESGDGIQTLKAGILETADFFVVNKSDRPGADLLLQELNSMLEMSGKEKDKALLTNHKDPQSLENLYGKLTAFFDQNSNLIKKRRRHASLATAQELIERDLLKEMHSWLDTQKLTDKNPYEFFLQFQKTRPRLFNALSTS